MFDKLEDLLIRFEEIMSELNEPNVTDDQNRFRKLMKEQSDLQPLVDAYKEYKECKQTEADSLEMLEAESDEEMRELLKEELSDAKKRIEELEAKLKILLLPKDPNDDKNVIVEIRAGAGGDEAALFAAELYRMYVHYAESRRWKVETMEVDVQIDEKDIRIDVMRASGNGGQCVNTTDSAVRLTHYPSGIVVYSQTEKSQLQNKAKAFALLRAKLYDIECQKAHDAEAEARRSQIGTGDRSEKIRTYNFPQGRVTDHRINLTLYKLDKIMDGDIQEIIDACIAADQAAKLAKMNEN